MRKLLQPPLHLLGAAEYQLVSPLGLRGKYGVTGKSENTGGGRAGRGDTEGGKELDDVEHPAAFIEIQQVKGDARICSKNAAKGRQPDAGAGVGRECGHPIFEAGKRKVSENN